MTSPNERQMRYQFVLVNNVSTQREVDLLDPRPSGEGAAEPATIEN
jgi:hypothetical protein